MSAPEQTTEAPDRAQDTAIYVYGIVPADVETEDDASGVGDPPARVTTVRHGEIAALVSEIRVDRPLGTPADLQAHASLLDGCASVTPVLPLRFGAVMTNADAVTEELLAAHHDDFLAALNELEGCAQYVVKGRYVERTILNEVLAESDEAARLRDAIRDQPEDATREARMALGELISRAIEAKRDADTRTVIEALDPISSAVNVREPTNEEDAVHIAVLIELAKEPDLEEAVNKLAQEWDGRVEMRVLGPMAAYDFVMKREPEG